MISFLRTNDPSEVAIRYIERAVRRTPANTVKASVVIDNIRNNMGDLFLILNNYRTVGIVYLTVDYTDEGKVLCPLLVGGDNIREWHDDLFKFIVDIKVRMKAVAIHFIARKGWHKSFPMTKVIGHIYEYRGGSSDK